MNRPRPLARRLTGLAAVVCVVGVSALVACDSAPTATPAATPALSPTPTATPTPVPTAATPTPDEPAPTFLLDALLTVFGYRQDRTAEVELSIELRNDGSVPAQVTSPIVTVECVLNGEPVSGCGGPLDGLILPDGVGREEAVMLLRAPMGTELRAALDDGTASNTVVVPERILGVERDTWACFSDRPQRSATHENDFLGGCGGWTSGTVLKWDPDEPVRVWADPTGDARYVRILERTLDDLAPLLNLDVEWVDTEDEATLRGVRRRAVRAGLEHRPRRVLPGHGRLRRARFRRRWRNHERIHERLAEQPAGSPTD